MLETKIIDTLLKNIELIPFVELDEKWFLIAENKLLAKAFLVNGIQSLKDVEQVIKDYDPFTSIDFDHLEDRGFDGEYIAPLQKLEAMLKELKIAHLKDDLIKLSKRYSDNPTVVNFEKMRAVSEELEEEQAPPNDGSLNESLDELRSRFEKEVPMGLKSYGKLDMALGGGLKGGQLITIGARPGVGKSAFGVNLAAKILERNPKARVDFFVLEMSQRSMVERFITLKTGVQTLKIQHAKKMIGSNKEKEKVMASYDYYENSKLRIYDDLFDCDDIIRTIRRNSRENDEYIAFIDYLGLMQVSDKRKQAYEKVSEITRKLKMLTNDSDIPVVVFSQLNRAIESRQNKRPNLSDLRDSGSVEQDSNIVGFLYATEPRDDEEEFTILDIQKNREGNIGAVKYRFDKALMNFEEVFT